MGMLSLTGIDRGSLLKRITRIGEQVNLSGDKGLPEFEAICAVYFSDNKALNRSEQLKEGSGRLLQKQGRQKSLTIPCSDSFTLFPHAFIIFLCLNVITQCTLQNIIYYIIPGGQRFPCLLRNRPRHVLFFSLPRHKWPRFLTAFCQFKLTVYKSQRLCSMCCFTKALTPIIRVTSRFLHFLRAAWTCKTVVGGCQGVAMWLQRCSAWF